jgi:signal transduction histidine kinase
VRWGEGSQLVTSVGELAQQYRNTVLLNLALLALAWIVVLLALRDVRRLARAEAKARHEARLRELESRVRHGDRLASLGRMATDIAHEINNPLEGMANYLSLLEESLRSGSTEEARALTLRVREGLGRVATIIRQVLRFGSLSAVPKEKTDLRDVIVKTVDFAKASPRAAGVAIEMSGSSEPLPVYGNTTALSQLVSNLFFNACEAQSTGGVVRVEWAIEDGFAAVRVSDRGPGLPAEDLERVFEPFHSTKGSSGLGLTVSHGIATEHGGSLRAENLPDGGACFTLKVPLIPRKERSSRERSAVGAEGAHS